MDLKEQVSAWAELPQPRSAEELEAMLGDVLALVDERPMVVPLYFEARFRGFVDPSTWTVQARERFAELVELWRLADALPVLEAVEPDAVTPWPRTSDLEIAAREGRTVLASLRALPWWRRAR